MKWVTRLFVFAFIALPILQSCSINVNNGSWKGNAIKGNGTIVNKQINISDYTKIDLDGCAEVIYEHVSEEAPYLQVNIDENLFPLLDIKVVNGKLSFRTVDNQNINATKFTVYTNSRNIDEVLLSGAGYLYLKGEVNSKDMKIKISGAGELVTDSLYCEKFSLDMSGAGEAKLAGAANTSSFNISGAGSIKGYNFFVQDLYCKISGAGNLQANVGESIDANVSGAGNIKYKGNPRSVNKNVSGAGSISNTK